MAHIYRPRHQRQLIGSDPFGKFNCTAYAAAMFADAVTLGGSRVTGKQVRAWSSEPIPNPSSPGLNIAQVGVVLRRLGITCTDRTGQSWAAVVAALKADRRVIAQVAYGELGPDRCQSGDFGHALLLQLYRDSRPGFTGPVVFANDPLCGAAKWYSAARIHAAMTEFADDTHVPGTGLRFAIGRIVPHLP